jgi:Fe-S-cluster containining protein
VPLSIPEVFFVFDRISALPPSERAARMVGLRRVEEEIERRGLAAVWLDAQYDDARAYDAALALLREPIACPFLDEVDACSIHAERPLRCREFNVTSPAAWCADPERHAVRTVPVGTPLSTPLARLAAEMTGAPVRLVPLALALRFAEQERDLAARAWPGPELFERFLDLLE